jgi:chromosome segregation protein
MVKLQKLVLKNFKSFRKAEVPLARGFTAIVGSNGSGKSNILDALMFVMGATSLKTLRASRLTDLVNKGAAENYAKVDLVVAGGDKKYEISRMIDKQGKSVYRLDGNRKTLNEVSSLLLELGITAAGHNIVMQGDVTRVVEMSPEQRREIIDELAGLSEFDSKKEESLKMLDRVEAKIKESNIVLQEREHYLDNLEKDRNAAMEFEKLEEEKQRAKATIIFGEIEKANGFLRDFEDRAFKVGEEKNSAEEKISLNEQKQKEFREKIEEISNKIMHAGEKAYNTIGQQLEEKRAEIRVEEEKIESKKTVVSSNNNKAHSLSQKIMELEEAKQLKENRLEDIGKESVELEKELNIVEEKKNAIESKYSAKENEIKRLEAELRELRKGNEETKEKIFEKNSLIRDKKNRIQLKKQSMGELSKEASAVEEKLSVLQKKKSLLDGLLAKYNNPETALKKLVLERENVIAKLKDSEARVSIHSKDIVELKKSIAKCPFCESKIDTEKRKRLLQSKESEQKQLMLRAQSLKEEEAGLKNKIGKMDEIVFRKKELVLALKDLPEIENKRLELKKRINALKKELEVNSVESESLELEKLEKQLVLGKGRESEKEKRIGLVKEASGFDALKKLTDSLKQMVTKKELLQQEKSFLKQDELDRIEREKKESIAEIESMKKENGLLEKEIAEMKEIIKKINREVSGLEVAMDKAEREKRQLMGEKEKLEGQLQSQLERQSSLQSRLKSLEKQENSLMIERSKQEVKIADLSEEFKQFEGVKVVEGTAVQQLRERLSEIDKRIKELGAINMKAIESFDELRDEVVDARKKVDKLEEERMAVLEMIEKIEVKRTNIFWDCFNAMNKNFADMYFTLFGGQGQLSLSNEEKPLESGLIIEAKHKGESLQNIDSMSGGEKTLTALAFMFAIQLYEPAPFYIFDEADAALDKENSSKLVKIIKNASRGSQFIAITHNDPLVKEADQIIGVALNKEKSSVIGLKLKEKMERQVEETVVGNP